jgi:hypothetical protein
MAAGCVGAILHAAMARAHFSERCERVWESAQLHSLMLHGDIGYPVTHTSMR